jgi:hypothetical protein
MQPPRRSLRYEGNMIYAVTIADGESVDKDTLETRRCKIFHVERHDNGWKPPFDDETGECEMCAHIRRLVLKSKSRVRAL